MHTVEFAARPRHGAVRLRLAASCSRGDRRAAAGGDWRAVRGRDGAFPAVTSEWADLRHGGWSPSERLWCARQSHLVHCSWRSGEESISTRNACVPVCQPACKCYSMSALRECVLMLCCAFVETKRMTYNQTVKSLLFYDMLCVPYIFTHAHMQTTISMAVIAIIQGNLC